MTHSGPSRVGSDCREGFSPNSELILLKDAVETRFIITKNCAVAIPKGASRSDFREEIAAKSALAVPCSGCPAHGVVGKNAKGRFGVGFGQAFQGINRLFDVAASALPRIVESTRFLE
jgi:hypothetical protein